MELHVRKRVVILGGGFAGLAAALELARQPAFHRDGQVLLVDKNCYHLYHALLYEVATATFDVRPEDLEYLQGGVCVRLKSLGEQLTKRQIDFLQARVTGIDVQRRRMTLADQPELPYHELVVALGSEAADFGIPGLLEHSLTLRDVPDALAIRERMRALVERARQSPDRPQSVVVAGGGFSGVELAGELLQSLRHLIRRGQCRAGAVQLTMVEAGSTVLAALGPSVSAMARTRLERLGARVVVGQPMVRVEAHQVVLGNGTHVPYDLLLWTGGVQANPLLRTSGLPTTGRGQLVVDRTLRVPGVEHVWGAGDCIAFQDSTGHSIPQVAPLAVDAGRQVARNILRTLRGWFPLPFHPRRPGFVVPIGGKYAIAQTRWFRSSGFMGWCYRKLVDLRYFTTIMSFRQALRMFLRGARVYLEND